MNDISKSTSALSATVLKDLIRYHIQVAKVPLCLLVACSSFFGYILVPSQPVEKGFIVFSGVFLLATGAASLNSVQERLTDQSMGRTRRRPLAQGLVSRQCGLRQARLLLASGFLVLYTCSLFPGTGSWRYTLRFPLQFYLHTLETQECLGDHSGRFMRCASAIYRLACGRRVITVRRLSSLL